MTRRRTPPSPSEPSDQPPLGSAAAHGPDADNGYSSFVVKWRRRLGAERIEVEHIQSGESTRVSSASDALAWMRRHVC